MSQSNLSKFQWCSNEDSDTFIVLDNNVLTMYGVEEIDRNYVLQNRELKLSDNYVARELSVKRADKNKKYKCFAVCPDPQNHQNVLLAHADKSKVVVVDMNTCDEIGECILKTRIPINLLEWGKVQKNHVAIASERMRSVKGVQIVDVNKISGDNKSRGIVAELGNQGDAVKSMSWSPHRNELAAGFRIGKHLRIFDMRNPDKSVSQVIDVQEIEGISYAPKSENILASYNDETVRLWDRRYLRSDAPYREKLNLSTGDIEKIAWCPTQEGRLGVITSKSRHVHIMDFSFSRLDGEKNDAFLPDQAVVTRHKSPPNMLEATISNFSWHPTAQNRILCCKVQDNNVNNTMLCDISLCEKIAVEWSSHNQLIWGCANSLVTSSLSSYPKPDIADVIYKRIDDGYGFDAEKNISLVKKEDQNLAVFWQFFKKVQAQHPWDCRLGVRHFVEQERNPNESMREEMEIIPNVPRTYYTSEARKKALEVCGWPQKQYKSEIQNRITNLHKQGEYNKSAAIALFYWGVKQAMDQLCKPESLSDLNSNNGKNDREHLYIFSVALSGYTTTRSSQWYEQSKLLGHTTDPYQRAMFEFLTVEPNSMKPYKKILEDKQLELEDRVGFACRFLPDEMLREYIINVTEREVAAGNIKAVILTGVSSSLVGLMQKYLDDTSDIQTVCIALCLAKSYTKTHEKFKTFPDKVLESYRELFDIRSLWIQRAEFDVKLLNNVQLYTQSKSVINTKAVGAHIQIKCPSCKKSVAGGTNNPNTYAKSLTMRGSQHQQRRTIRCCPNTACKNPGLPRCSLCLFNLGTPSQYSSSKPVIRQTRSRLTDNRSNAKQNPTDKWFVWCQGCGHGGHAQHMQDWFDEHKQCPVPNCDCRCSILDFPAQIDPPL